MGFGSVRWADLRVLSGRKCPVRVSTTSFAGGQPSSPNRSTKASKQALGVALQALSLPSREELAPLCAAESRTPQRPELHTISTPRRLPRATMYATRALQMFRPTARMMRPVPVCCFYPL